ncbi:MAG TPA: ABC transporter ATP-binding protein [Caldithrix abyssi]|uniref:ABC transporter ATP-binding protein n=1 Tax=Caldithrix abyssi TaxID=187145 RepID=A0A7V4U0R1_CALAY|nr:ABC transporter ATP-binding protein [Caldithrix abyssi]
MIQIRNLHKQFDGKIVLRGVELDVYDGERLVIIGRSGCGKSVLLKHIINLLQPDKGYILVDDIPIKKVGQKDLFFLRKQFGFLFQGAALFDSMSVAENIALPLVEHTRMTHDEMMKKVAEKLELVGLPGIEHLKPSELSGGMKKRVGLARAIVMDPKYILYDEPTTGLDPIMAANIDKLIIDLSEKLKVTSIVVTHDMQSVSKVADRVVMLHNGRILFGGTVDELYASKDPVLKQFVNAETDGPIQPKPFKY